VVWLPGVLRSSPPDGINSSGYEHAIGLSFRCASAFLSFFPISIFNLFYLFTFAQHSVLSREWTSVDPSSWSGQLAGTPRQPAITSESYCSRSRSQEGKGGQPQGATCSVVAAPVGLRVCRATCLRTKFARNLPARRLVSEQGSSGWPCATVVATPVQPPWLWFLIIYIYIYNSLIVIIISDFISLITTVYS